ncbi:AMP-dependent synthetase and ligase [Podospora australis]|uniref:AMP-dependent synthetase and ligase n=1 Tax=Podospora australis TaxID=1536484 RepID=A0AAN7ABA6_9PEZI|nr:AMP-dependent synthetase and ligase [Podospora australis]
MKSWVRNEANLHGLQLIVVCPFLFTFAYLTLPPFIIPRIMEIITKFFKSLLKCCHLFLEAQGKSIAPFGYYCDFDEQNQFPRDPSKDPNVVEWAFSGDYDPEMPILIDALEPTRSLSKRQVTEFVTMLAGSFEPREVVCLHLSNSILYPVLVLSILVAGCKWTGTNTSYTSVELAHHLRVSKARYIITSADHLATVETAVQQLSADNITVILFSDLLTPEPSSHGSPSFEKSYRYQTLHDLLTPLSSSLPLSKRLSTISPENVASLMSTSGTTGLPKMAQRTHRALIAESQSDEVYDARKPYPASSITRLFCTPMFHAYSFPKMVINPLRQGQPTYIMKRFDAPTFASKLAEFGITDIIAVPPILARLVEYAKMSPENKNSLQSLRTVLCAGAPLTSQLRDEFLGVFEEKQKIVLAQEWGMTECGCITRAPPHQNFSHEEGSVGVLVGGYQVIVDTSELTLLPSGRRAGELLAKGPQLMEGYLGDVESTANAFVNGEDGGKWYRTGDVGYVEEETGQVFIVDRVKDMIKINGWQVSPAELEGVVMRLPGVVDACAVSVGHSLDEHAVLCVVGRKDDGVEGAMTEKQIKEHMRSHLSRYKTATCEVRIVQSLPRAASGKILRRLVRSQLCSS